MVDNGADDYNGGYGGEALLRCLRRQLIVLWIVCAVVVLATAFALYKAWPVWFLVGGFFTGTLVSLGITKTVQYVQGRRELGQ